MSTLDNPSVGKAGMVIVGYEIGDYVPIDFELPRQLVHLGRCMPIRFAANHSCYNDTLMQKLADFVVHAVSSFVRLRLRIHCGTLIVADIDFFESDWSPYHFSPSGSHQECRYRLLTVGVPVRYLPITLDGELVMDNHRLWLNYRSEQERAQGYSVPPNVVPPLPNYVEDEDMELV